MTRCSPTLASVPFPAAGEHPAGYHRRLAVANGFTTLRQMRVAHGFGAISPLSGDETWALLQQATALPIERLRPLAWRPVEGAAGRWLDMWRHPVRARDLDLTNMRHCPACLANDLIVRVEWSIRSFTACPTHRVALVDACAGCGRTLSLDNRTDLFSCGACGSDLLTAPLRPADPREIELAAALEAAIGLRPARSSTCALPAELLALDLGDMAAVLERLATLARLTALESAGKSTSSRGAIVTVSEDARWLRAAHALLTNWPDNHLLLLNDLARDVPPPSSGVRARFPTPAGRLATRALASHDGRTVDFLARPTRGFLLEGLGIEPRRRAPGAKPMSPAPGPVPPGSFTPISHASAMERLEGRATEKLAHWWIKAGLLHEHAREGDAVLSLEEVGALRLQLEAIASTEPEPLHPIDMARIDRSFTVGREYRKDRFLHDLMEGRVSCWRVDGAAGLAGLRFAACDVERLRGVAKVEHWIATGAHVALSAFNAAAVAIWGIDAALPISRWNQLARSGEVRFVYYDPPTPGARRQKRWNVQDLTRAIQDGGFPALVCTRPTPRRRRAPTCPSQEAGPR